MLNFFKDSGVVLSLDADRLRVEGLKQLPPEQADKIRAKIRDNRDEIIKELSATPRQDQPGPDPGDLSQPPAGSTTAPSAEPAGLGSEYEQLWAAAWAMFDEIDNPFSSMTLDERKAMLPALFAMTAKLAEIERAGIKNPDPAPSLDGAWTEWESDTTIRDRTPENCPAKCKRSGKCYALAYFEGKPGKPKACEPETCKYITNERGNHDSQTVGYI